MRNLRATVVTLGLVALVSFVLVLAMSAGSDDDSLSAGSWQRQLLAFAPIRPRGPGKHRHGAVEVRYQNPDCTEGPTTTSTTTVPTTTTTTTGTTTTSTTGTSTTGTSTTTTTGTTTTSTTAPNTTTTTTTTTSTTSTTSTTTTTTGTTTTSVTTSPCRCPVCPNTTDLCRPWDCVCSDQTGNGTCVQLRIRCDDGNRCTNDACVNGVCQYVYNASIPGCSCATLPNFCSGSNACNPLACQDTNSGPICVGFPGIQCDDGNNCTTDACVWNGGAFDNVNCTYTFNSTLPGCAFVPGGLTGGQIAGIVIGAVAAAAIAALLAAWARRKPTAAPGSTSAATTPLATTSPLYADPVNAGVMPAL